MGSSSHRISPSSLLMNTYRDNSSPSEPPYLSALEESTLDCELEEPDFQYPLYKSRWRRILDSIFSSPSTDTSKDSEGALPLLSSDALLVKRFRKRFRKFKLLYCLWVPLIGFFVMLGIIQFISIVCGIAFTYFPDEFDHAVDHWLNPDSSPPDISRWPTDISRDIIPVGCHSHNDYWRRVPLFSALQAGCISVEADVWLFDDELYVGHSTSALTPKRTLRSMYIDPLVEILDRQNPVTRFHGKVDRPFNGVFDTDPSQTLALLVDFKTDGAETWIKLTEQLSPLRDRGYLSYFNGVDVVSGPITVIGTGDTPFDLVVSNSTYRDIFFDAPLDVLAEDDLQDQPSESRSDEHSAGNTGQDLSDEAHDNSRDAFNSTNSYYASVSLKKSIGSPWPFHFTLKQMDLMRAQIRGAHRRGLKVRYWSLPAWPRSLRNHVWSVLVREGVDILNVDDLQGAANQEWSTKVLDWWV
ncbi:hypothetical protein PHISCL_03241 [Aspergillus sclerotialis]|uniref:Altered inheritance of mitochondria protein 6 n=1 Tax=Aspergillus sclerotialis TaxID=2070753 RepID=A0A3A2ZSS0_9EURO|nr:hypothetical protein PHISCL_03241 [Aspergillus sclerotialis]